MRSLRSELSATTAPVAKVGFHPEVGSRGGEMLTLLGCPGADTRDRHRPLQPSRDVASDASLQNFPYKTEVFKGRKVTRKDCDRICQQDAKCLASRFDAALHSCALFGQSTDEPTPASTRPPMPDKSREDLCPFWTSRSGSGATDQWCRTNCMEIKGFCPNDKCGCSIMNAQAPKRRATTLERLSHSDLLQTRYTCTTNLSLGKAYPAVAAERGRRWQLDVPADAHWLFYGPSYLGQVFSTFVAANDGRIVRIENLNAETLLHEFPPATQRDATCIQFPDYCKVRAEKQKCEKTVAFGIQRVTLDNGAVLVGVHNNELLQKAGAENARHLSRVVKHLKPHHTFYQHPHDFETYAGVRNAGCAVLQEQEYQLQRGAHWRRHQLTNASRGPYMENMCVQLDELHTKSEDHVACVGRSASWDAIRRATPSVTIVAPAPVTPAPKGHPGFKGVARVGTHASGIYYTQPVVKRYNCAVLWDLAAGLEGVGFTLPPNATESWLLLGHQCVVLTDGRDEFLGGPIMEIAEDLLKLALASSQQPGQETS